MHARPPRTLLHFGDFELDPASGELRRGEDVIRLQPQPCKILVHLANRPGRVVPRSELYGVLWPEGRHVDAERGLNFCVKELRKTLGDDARAPTFVETLPRRGYRFVAEVTASSPAPSLVPARSREERRAGWTQARWLPLGLLAVLAMGALAGVGAMRRPSASVEPASVERVAAPEAYLEGRYLASRGTPEDLERSLDAFRRSVEASPEYAPAWTALAEIHLARARLVAHDSRASLDQAWAAAKRSVDLDAASAAGQVAWSKAVLYRDLDWTSAIEAAKRAVELDLASGPAHSHLAFLLAGRGEHQGALAAAEIARRLAPENPAIYLDLGWYHYLARDYEAAVEACGRALELAPEFTPAFDCLQSAHAAAGQLDLALEAASQAGRNHEAGLSTENAWHQQRRAEVATLEATAAVSRCAAVPLAVELAELGETDAAFAWLETAWSGRSSWLPLVAVEPRFDPLRGDPRWPVFLAKLGLGDTHLTPPDD